MLSAIISFLSANFLFLILYLGGSSFPKPLTAAEEEHYLKLWSEGDINARNVLVERNMRLVVHIIKKYYAANQDQDDLISIGTIGLIKAVSTFQPCKGTRLATYAARCIENEILMYFRSVRKMSGDISLNDTIDTDGDGNSLSLIDVLSSEDSMIDDVDAEGNAAKLNEYVKTVLTPREREIIVWRYGLFGKRRLTQNVIADRLAISRSYVSRIEKRALEKLREAFENNNKKVP